MSGLYTLIVVNRNGSHHSTSLEGYFAESQADKLFDEVIKDGRVIYAAVCDPPEQFGDSPRRVYCKKFGG